MTQWKAEIWFKKSSASAAKGARVHLWIAEAEAEGTEAARN